MSILTDPFSKDIGLRPPKISDDIVLVTHEHFDHNDVSGASRESFLVRGPGEYEVRGVLIRGIQSYHDNMNGKIRGLNTLYVISFEQMNLCHLGDLGQASLIDDQIEQIGDVDVLFVPVGGVYTIDAKESIDIIQQIEPKIIIPMHYKIPGLAIDLHELNPFVKEIGLVPEEVDKRTRITKKELPVGETKLLVFQT